MEYAVTLGDVQNGKASMTKYFADCYERNKSKACHREAHGHRLCVECPKSEATK